MKVLAHARSKENAENVASNLNCEPVWGDVTKPDEVIDIAKQVKKAGGVDWIVHNAGILSKDKNKGAKRTWNSSRSEHRCAIRSDASANGAA